MEVKRRGTMCLQAIEVKRVQHSDGSVSLKAFCAAGSYKKARAYNREYDDDAWETARQLIRELDWPGEYVMGVLKNGNYVVTRVIGG